jgi:hypothetical protein
MPRPLCASPAPPGGDLLAERYRGEACFRTPRTPTPGRMRQARCPAIQSEPRRQVGPVHCGSPAGGVRHATPLSPACVQGLDLASHLLAIEPVIVLNAAFCEHHLVNCPPSEELTRECGLVRPSAAAAAAAARLARLGSVPCLFGPPGYVRTRHCCCVWADRALLPCCAVPCCAPGARDGAGAR